MGGAAILLFEAALGRTDLVTFYLFFCLLPSGHTLRTEDQWLEVAMQQGVAPGKGMQNTGVPQQQAMPAAPEPPREGPKSLSIAELEELLVRCGEKARGCWLERPCAQPSLCCLTPTLLSPVSMARSRTSRWPPAGRPLRLSSSRRSCARGKIAPAARRAAVSLSANGQWRWLAGWLAGCW